MLIKQFWQSVCTVDWFPWYFQGAKIIRHAGSIILQEFFFYIKYPHFLQAKFYPLFFFLVWFLFFCDKLIFTLYSTLYSVQYDFHYNIMSSWRLMYTVVPMDIQDFIKKSFWMLIWYTNSKFLVTKHNVALFLKQAWSNNKSANLFRGVFTY